MNLNKTFFALALDSAYKNIICLVHTAKNGVCYMLTATIYAQNSIDFFKHKTKNDSVFVHFNTKRNDVYLCSTAQKGLWAAQAHAKKLANVKVVIEPSCNCNAVTRKLAKQIAAHIQAYA